MEKNRLVKIAGFSGILFPIVFFLSIQLALFDSPWFRWTHNALSELGVEGISAFFFNNGLVVVGIFCLIFSIGLAKSMSNKIGAYILALSAISLIGVGIFPLTIFELHYISSASFFFLLTFSLLVIGITMKINHFDDKMGLIAIILALLACSSVVFLNFFQGIAIPETIACLPTFLWCMIYGLKMASEGKLKKLL